MKINISKLKTTAQTKIKNIYTTSSKNVLDGYVVTKQVGEKVKAYLASAEYEADLDEVIADIYVLNPFLDVPKFDFTSRKKRIVLKTKFLLKQSIVFIGTTATIGAKLGSYTRTPQGVAAGGTIGTGAGAAAVLFIAGFVAFRRFAPVEDSAELVTV